MSKKTKCLIISILLFFLMFFARNYAFGSTTSTSIDDPFTTTMYDNDSDTKASNAARNIITIGINVIRVVGTGISIIMLSYIAIKYMSAAPAEKAEFKKSATIYVVGAVLLFAGSNILSMIISVASSNIATSAAPKAS